MATKKIVSRSEFQEGAEKIFTRLLAELAADAYPMLLGMRSGGL